MFAERNLIAETMACEYCKFNGGRVGSMVSCKQSGTQVKDEFKHVACEVWTKAGWEKVSQEARQKGDTAKEILYKQMADQA